MRIRTGHTPDAWTANEPAPAIASHFRVRGALVTAQPAKPLPLTYTSAELARRKRTLAKRKAERVERIRDDGPRCERMTRSGEPCARRRGHSNDWHAGRTAMDRKNESRRTGGVAA